jgi:large repetitive protein
VSTLFGDSTASRHYGAGIEVGYLLATNLWVSGGYNFFGYRDADLAGTEYTNKGAYLRLRYKFDEDLLPAAVTGVKAKEEGANAAR